MNSSLQAKLLVAVPQLVGPFFTKSVIFILDNSPEGSTGIVLNHPTDHTLAELNETLQASRRKDDRLYLGGPVDPTVALIIHNDTYQGPDTKPVTTGLALSTTLESIQVMAESSSLPFRCFMGYAGWAPQQLEGEIAKGSWLLNPLIPELLFSDQTATMWETVLGKMGLDPLTIGPGAFD
ncbi:MAG: YqgE/AlgH family protein [Fidelibacterota bacterium]